VTIFDYLVLFVLVTSIVISMMRGLVKEILSLLSWIVALVVANLYGDALAGLLPALIPGHATRLIVAFAALLIAVKLLMMLFTLAVESIIKASGLSVADRGLGGVFGLARGVVIVMAAVLLCGMTAIPQQAFWKNALFRPMAESLVKTALPFMPGAVASHVKF
jgi:membrane protein required for colicin V production